MPDSRFLGAPQKVIQERLVRIDGMNQCAELFRQHHCLTTCPAAGVNDDAKRALRQKTQDMQCMKIAPRTQFFYPFEEKVNWVKHSYPHK